MPNNVSNQDIEKAKMLLQDSKNEIGMVYITSGEFRFLCALFNRMEARIKELEDITKGD